MDPWLLMYVFGRLARYGCMIIAPLDSQRISTIYSPLIISKKCA